MAETAKFRSTKNAATIRLSERFFSKKLPSGENDSLAKALIKQGM
jgi:hypothetical protein